jgi:hypothetical protein
MKQTHCVLLVITLLISGCKPDNTQKAMAQTAANGRDTTISFSGAEPSKLPSGWSAETGNWATSLADLDGSLKMESNDGSDFNIAVLKSKTFLNTEIEVRVKALQGEEDQVAAWFGAMQTQGITTL